MATFDDELLQRAMRHYLEACDDLADAVQDGEIEERVVIDLSESKSVAALALHRRLQEMGWVQTGSRAPEPASQ